VNCVTEALEDHGLHTKCVVFSNDNMNTDLVDSIALEIKMSSML
jgi:hypothetical protein